MIFATNFTNFPNYILFEHMKYALNTNKNSCLICEIRDKKIILALWYSINFMKSTL